MAVSSPYQLFIGDHAVLKGLTNDQFNGSMGMITSNTVNQRHQVLMDDGSTKNIKPANISKIPRRKTIGA